MEKERERGLDRKEREREMEKERERERERASDRERERERDDERGWERDGEREWDRDGKRRWERDTARLNMMDQRDTWGEGEEFDTSLERGGALHPSSLNRDPHTQREYEESDIFGGMRRGRGGGGGKGGGGGGQARGGGGRGPRQVRWITHMGTANTSECAHTHTRTHASTHTCVLCRKHLVSPLCYGVATISRLLKIIGLFCRISSLL